MKLTPCPKYLSTSVWLAVVIASSLAVTSCNSDKDSPGTPPIDPGGVGGSGGGRDEDASMPPPPDPCMTPGHLGCACDEVGITAECGKVVERNGEYVTCSMGRATCDGKAWGDCIGNRIIAKSVPGTSLNASGRKILGTPTNCANVCDPNDCKSTVNTGKDVDASVGVTITDAGVSITPGEAGTGGSGPCKGLFCQIPVCDGGGKTTISGTVYDPAGKNPLYNAFVYIPTDPTVALPAFTSGASCDTCAGTGSISAISMAQTGADGKFTLSSQVPAGSGIPLVVQMGKWRRKVILPTVNPCVNNVVAPSNSRLPKNRTDGDGGFADIPKMALASGSADPFECLLLKIGIDASEIQFPSDTSARIHYYKYNGIDRDPGGAPTGSTLTGNLTTLKSYDAILLPCEGGENTHNTQALNVAAYADVGGRVFATHYGYVWLATPSFGSPQNLTSFYGTANWYLDHSGYNDPMTGNIDTSFPKGAAFAQWLVNVGASTTLGQMSINEPRWDAKSSINPPSQRWMYGKSKYATSTDMLLSMTFNTPVSAAPADQCGRVVFSDFHVSADALVNQRANGACVADTDCGFGATCLPPVAGTCSDETCTKNSNCDLSGSTCVGYVPTGSCVNDTCSFFSSCNRGTCTGGQCICTANNQCGSGVCISGVGCTASACSDDSDCGRSQRCTGPTPGVCRKACTSDSQCGGALCVSGVCKGCYVDNDCPDWSQTCVGGSASSCSSTSSRFPLTCRNGDLSAQEKALEFMLFDLTSCVSPDSWTPPAPTTVYNPVTFTQDFTSTCGKGQRPAWREFNWQASIPSTASIGFSAQTADDAAALATAQSVTAGNATTTTPDDTWDTTLLDGGPGIGVLRNATPTVISKNLLRMTITLNPTTDKKASPTLIQWKVQYDCVDSE
jgi:hypothetical protein